MIDIVDPCLVRPFAVTFIGIGMETSMLKGFFSVFVLKIKKFILFLECWPNKDFLSIPKPPSAASPNVLGLS